MPTFDNYLQFRLMKQEVAVDELWEGFRQDIIKSRLLEDVEVRFPKVVEEGFALGGEEGDL